MSELPRGVIGVPGNWRDRDEVVRELAAHARDYVYLDDVLTHVESGRIFTLEKYEFEPRMREAFVCAGAGRIPEKELELIAAHHMTLYVSGDVGSIETTDELMQAALALLNSGGLGVKIESSGVAHSRSLWPLLCEDDDLSAMLHAMVAFVGEGENYYSCGMHHFGLRDVVIEAPLDPAGAGKLMEGFCGYMLIEQPAMLDGETFSLEDGEPRFEMQRDSCDEFDADDLFHNPYGIWRLRPHNDAEVN